MKPYLTLAILLLGGSLAIASDYQLGKLIDASVQSRVNAGNDYRDLLVLVVEGNGLRYTCNAHGRSAADWIVGDPVQFSREADSLRIRSGSGKQVKGKIVKTERISNSGS
jgi:hypothetical protein